jgi:hypothetical protein
MNDTDADACSETEKLPNHNNDLLSIIWKMMQEEMIEWERIRQETEEKQETNRMEDKERLEQLIKQIREDVERMKESLVKKCEDRASKLASDISNLEKKTQHSIVEINSKMQSVEKIHCQRISEAKVSQAAIVAELVEHKQSVENSLSMFRNELIEIRKGMSAENRTVISEKLEAASRDNSSKLGKLDDRLYILEEKVGAAARTVVLPSADNHYNVTEVSAQAGLSSSRTGKDGF